MTTNAFDSFVGDLDGALVVVTTASDGGPAGCVVGFHTQSSMEPVRYAVWLSKANRTYRVALLATHLAVHVLDAADRSLLQLFGGTTGDDTDKFALCEWAPGPGGVPLLARCTTRVVLRRTSLTDDGGDHVCFVGEPIAADAAGSVVPMRLSAALDVEPGHPAGDRAAHDEPVADDDHPAGHGSPMSEESRRALESAAAGAGHAVRLDDPDDPGE